MGPIGIAAFAVLVVFTSFLAGVFGVAGGMILMGGLLLLVPVADAMVLHGITQLTANGWRAAIWVRYIDRSILFRYALGLGTSLAIFLLVSFVPDQRTVFLVLGLTPFIGRFLPVRMVPQVHTRLGAETCGLICTMLQLLSGVSGPMLDIFFARSDMDRRTVVATKAACQIMTHLTKLMYFGVLATNAIGISLDPIIILIGISMAILGTTLSRNILERLTDHAFRRYTWWIIMFVGAGYIGAAAWG